MRNRCLCFHVVVAGHELVVVVASVVVFHIRSQMILVVGMSCLGQIRMKRIPRMIEKIGMKNLPRGICIERCGGSFLRR